MIATFLMLDAFIYLDIISITTFKQLPEKLKSITPGLEYGYAAAQGVNNSTMRQPDFKLYEDPSGRFTMEYPYDWTLFELEGGPDVAWNSANSTASQDQHIVVTISIPTGEAPPGATLQDLYNKSVGDASLRYLVTDVASPSFTSYTIDGHEAFSAMVNITAERLFNATERPTATVLLSIGSIINERAFLFEISTDPEDFDAVLPVIDRMIRSIKILNL